MRYASKLSQSEPGLVLGQLVHPAVFKLLELPAALPLPERVESADVLSLTYRAPKGHVLFRNDGIRILIEAFYGESPILRAALRDRQLDGTALGSPLTMFPNTDPAANRLPGPGFLAAEISIYSWDPSTYLAGLDVTGTVGHFLADPDHYIWKNFDPEVFFRLWEQAFFLGRAPWQAARPMSGVAAHFCKQSATLLKALGYHRVDAVPSWFNVARFFHKMGYVFTYGEHRLAFEAMVKDLKAFKLDRAQESWLVALQNIPESYIPPKLRLSARWPVTHTNMYWVRMHLDLNHYQAAAKHGELTERVAKAKIECHSPVAAPLSSGPACPCTSAIGASSPAVTGPATSPPPNSPVVQPPPSVAPDAR